MFSGYKPLKPLCPMFNVIPVHLNFQNPAGRVVTTIVSPLSTRCQLPVEVNWMGWVSSLQSGEGIPCSSSRWMTMSVASGLCGRGARHWNSTTGLFTLPAAFSTLSARVWAGRRWRCHPPRPHSIVEHIAPAGDLPDDILVDLLGGHQGVDASPGKREDFRVDPGGVVDQGFPPSQNPPDRRLPTGRSRGICGNRCGPANGVALLHNPAGTGRGTPRPPYR